MKSIALYLILSCLISFSLQYSDTSSSNSHTDSNSELDKKKHKAVPCESKCLACQQAAYNIKFYQKANCKNNHCKSTVYINTYKFNTNLIRKFNKKNLNFQIFQLFQQN